MITIKKIKLGQIKNYFNIIYTHDRPFRFLIGSLLALCGLSHFIFIYLNGYKIRFFPTSLSLSLFINPHERYMDDYYLSKILHIGNTFVDCGANIGTITIKAAKLVGQSGRVYSFEAHPKTVKYLETTNFQLFNKYL